MVSLLISLLVFAVVIYVVFLLLGMVVDKLPPVAAQIVWIVAALIAVVYLLQILGIDGGNFRALR